MHAPLRPATAALASLQSLVEDQREALMAGDADALAALSAQLRVQVAGLKYGGQALAASQERATLASLRALASANLALLQRRLMETHRMLEALGPGVALLEQSRARMTYESGGLLDSLPSGGRALGQA